MSVISPLRYPGGKARIYKKVKTLIDSRNLNNLIYVEPFAGGFGLGIQLMINNDIERFIINDIDYHIYSFWKSVFELTDEIIQLIQSTEISLAQREKQKIIFNNPANYTLLEVGFATLYLNRTNRSGILSAGPIGGVLQEGKYKINCRFNKEKIIQNIKEIAKYKNQVEVYNYDVIDFIDKIILSQKEKVFINFDPPYVIKGPVLYLNHYNELDHKNLQEKIDNDLNNVKWIISYDNAKIIKDLYSKYRQEEFILAHSVGKNKKGSELLIFSL